MKQNLRWLSLLLVLLMIVPLAVACNDKKDKENPPKESHKETERETQAETEQVLTPEQQEQLKAEMSDSILDALGQAQVGTTDTEPETQEEQTTEYAGVVEDLLGSLGGLGNGDYNYSEIISDVLDLYIGSEDSSDFMKELIKNWLANQFETGEQTTAPEANEEQSTEEQSTEAQLPDQDDQDSLQDYIADQTAQAVADAIVNRINEAIDSSVYQAIYDAVYNAMKNDEGYMDGILEEMIPGYGQLSGLLGGFGQ